MFTWPKPTSKSPNTPRILVDYDTEFEEDLETAITADKLEEMGLTEKQKNTFVQNIYLSLIHI